MGYQTGWAGLDTIGHSLSTAKSGLLLHSGRSSDMMIWLESPYFVKFDLIVRKGDSLKTEGFGDG
jgi:hypothetical protein